jgi:uncharacterized protein YndB with AHSA1/START domain
MNAFLLAALLAAAVSVEKKQESDGSHTLEHETVIDAPIDEVWAAVSSAEGWKSWATPVAWAPSPDVIETSYSPTAQPGDPSTIRQTVLLRVPRRLMVFRTTKAPERFPDFETYSKVVSLFELELAGEKRTRVRLTGTGYADTEAGRRLLSFFEKGNAVSLEALAKRFGGGSSPAALRKELEPLAFLVGHCWRAPISPGDAQDTHCFESALGGQHIRDRHEVRGSRGVYSGETLYSWNGSRVEYTYWNSVGGVSRGTMTATPGILDFGNETYRGRDGKQVRISTFWRKVGEDAYETVSRSSNSPTGQRVVRYVRID